MIQSALVFLSSVLMVLSAEAAMVALVRLATGPSMLMADAGTNAVAVVNSRQSVLVAFIVYSLSSCLRDAIVLMYGAIEWPHMAYVLSSVSRVGMIAGALIFVWAISRNICGHYLWCVVLGLAVAFSIIVLR